jgi:alkyl hydroperoxide reductase subunit AhpC
MEKFLYFAQGDGANATSEAVMYPVSAFRGADVAASSIVLYFTPAQITDVATSDVNDEITLTITDGDQKAVLKAIAEKIAGGTGIHQAPFIVVADEDNSVFCHSSITAVETVLAA